MSEYQYYEFVAVDRPLSDEQMRALRTLSTRARITPTRFVNHYDWGSFRGDPCTLMERCFDLFVHVADWGTRWFMMRLPRRLFDPATTELYFAAGDVCSAWAADEHVILQFEQHDIYDGSVEYEFDDGSGWLAALAPLREELLRGDMRCLYLGWLRCLQNGQVADNELEPPVPPGLHRLSASLQAFADFMVMDADILAVAADIAPAEAPANPSRRDLEDWIGQLSDQEKKSLLVRLLADEDPHARQEVRRLCSATRLGVRSEDQAANSLRRAAGEIVVAASHRRAERARRAAELEAAERARLEREAALARDERLDALAAQGQAPWNEVEALVNLRRPGDYDRAVTLLKDLQALAERAGTTDEFDNRLEQLRLRHVRKQSFVERLMRARLIRTDH